LQGHDWRVALSTGGCEAGLPDVTLARMHSPAREEDDAFDVHRQYRRTGDPRIRAAIAEAHTGLVRHLAARFANRGEAFDDLVQVGFVGLLGAIERFDPDRGRSFRSFAIPTIEGELKRHFRDHRWTVRVPRRVQENYLRLREAAGSLEQVLGRSPSLADLAGFTDLTEEDVLTAAQAGNSFFPLSLDGPSDERGSVENRITLPCRELESFEARTVVASLLSGLPERERQIVGLRYYQGLTQQQIASRMGMSQMYVSRLLARSLKAMRNAHQRRSEYVT
jgi:RNA polymerase sigma-B factor